MTQEELAELADLHRTYISDVERGARNLSLESIDKLARALGISLPVLFSAEDAVGASVNRLSTSPSAEHVEIVLVESNSSDANAALDTLTKAHLINSIRVATDGAEALDLLFGRGSFADNTKNSSNQVVLLALDLPKLSGVEVLRQLKADKRTCHLPVVIMTALDKHRDLTECKRLGAVGIMAKPLSFQGLSKAIPALNLSWALVKSPVRPIVNHSTVSV